MDNLCKAYSNWLCIAVLNDFAGRQLCHDVLFRKEKLPKDGTLLYKKLEYLKPECLYDEQRKKLFHSNGITDYTTFDMTLLARIIESKYENKYKLWMICGKQEIKCGTEEAKSFLTTNSISY